MIHLRATSFEDTGAVRREEISFEDYDAKEDAPNERGGIREMRERYRASILRDRSAAPTVGPRVEP